MSFKVGQKVVCVDATHHDASKLKAPLKNGEIYNVSLVVNCSCGAHIIGVGISKKTGMKQYCYCGNQIKSNQWHHTATRFRPLDHSFGENLATEIEQEINEEQLILK